MEKEKTIDGLNLLITINNDRIEGYETALKETEDVELKTLFEQFILTSQKCIHDLISQVISLGGVPAEGTITSVRIFRIWKDARAALKGKDRKAILNLCKNREVMAKDTYDKVLEDDFVLSNAKLFNLIYSQSSLLNDDHDHINALRAMLLEVQIAS